MGKDKSQSRQSSAPRPAKTYFKDAFNDDGQEYVESSLALLQRITTGPRYSGISISVLTFINVFFVFFFMFKLGFFLFGVNLDNNFTALFLGISVLSSLGIIILNENLRRKGDVLFEEISDELHWYVGPKKQSDNGVVADQRPSWNARVVLRSFAQATDLPLIPGKFGSALYAGVNILIAFLFLYFSLKH